MAHTPGPWRTRISHPRTVMAGGDRPGPGVVVVATAHDFDRNQAIANACLIAAAPELLAVLKELMGDDDGRSVPIGLVGVHSQVLGRMRAAIAKAEGR